MRYPRGPVILECPRWPLSILDERKLGGGGGSRATRLVFLIVATNRPLIIDECTVENGIFDEPFSRLYSAFWKQYSMEDELR